MEVVRFEDIEVDRCVRCGGLWFDALEHEELKQPSAP
jgi:Zn-finger nucleic acid-binding protein